MSTGFDIAEVVRMRWHGHAVVTRDARAGTCRVEAPVEDLRDLCIWLGEEMGFSFATLVVEESRAPAWSLSYFFYGAERIEVVVHVTGEEPAVPSLSDTARGPAYDWHEREAADLFGIQFGGHPRLGTFVLHENLPPDIHPMRHAVDAWQPIEIHDARGDWQAPTILSAPGSFAMPIGPVFSDFAESAHFLLETVGEDVVRTIARFFYKYRGVEKIAQGQPIDRALLLAERFSGTAAFAHGLAFCRAVEGICNVAVPERAKVLRTILAELERLRHHTATLTGICHSTALAVAESHAALIEEELLRLSCEIARHRYLFGCVVPGGVTTDLDDSRCARLDTAVAEIAQRLVELQGQLRYSSSFLDRLEEVGVLSTEEAISYGLVGPIARACGVAADLRKLQPYEVYETVNFEVPVEQEGDGYARLRIFLREALIAAGIIRHLLAALPAGPIRAADFTPAAGRAWQAVEAPSGAALHYVHLADDGTIARYHIAPPAFANWHGLHLAAENFAFQDFPIILASFGLSNAECDR